MNNEGYELSWEGEIQNDGPEFTLLPEGDYPFEVVQIERARYNGGEKLPPCNQVIVHLKIDSLEGTTTVKHNFYLHSKCEGLLCAFFNSIGQRKKGERFSMNWNKVMGSKGSCKLGIRQYTNKEGQTNTYNEIKKFHESEQPQTQQQSYQAPAQAAAAPGGFKAGRF